MIKLYLQLFGGRGAFVGIKGRLKNYKMAKILGDKIKNYLLNPNKSNGKSEIFRNLGYNMKNAAKLKADIREGLSQNKAEAYAPNEYGNSVYIVSMELGISQRKRFKTVWQIDKGQKAPRLITAYPG